MRIAIVNDVQMAVEALRRVVTSVPEYQIAWIAKDGEEAVRLCAGDVPDLILMDLMMPRMDGVEACKVIMARLTVRDSGGDSDGWWTFLKSIRSDGLGSARRCKYTRFGQLKRTSFRLRVAGEDRHY